MQIETSADNPESLLSLRGITKIYPTVVANNDIHLDIYPGQIHAILGENGAGKSTLMKIVYGATQPDKGEIFWRGQRHIMRNPAVARELGIGMVFQHFSLFETLSVVENISLAVPGSIAELSRNILGVGEQFGLDIDPNTLVHSLSVGERQRVEIIRCILQDPRLLILDEPTSVLPPQGVKNLFKTLRKLSDAGCAILYISHKLEEVRELCEYATILRGGQVSGNADPKRESADSLARMMIGKDIPETEKEPASTNTPVVLQLNKLSYSPEDPFGTSLSDIELSVRSGEIVGIAGVSGNGQNELMRVISGEAFVTSEHAERMRLLDQPCAHLGPAARRRKGLNFVPEERLGRGAVPALSLADNALLTGFDTDMSQRGFVRRSVVNSFTQQCIDEHDVRCGGHTASAQSLSGGNLQKYIVGREIQFKPKLLVVSQPTWGVDVGAAAAIRQELVTLKRGGTALLVVSEELEELFEICDRLYVMFGGRLSGSINTVDTDLLKIGSLMTGFSNHSQFADSDKGSSAANV